MTALTFTKITMPSATPNGESSLPPLFAPPNALFDDEMRLDEDDGLYIGYGAIDGVYPYRMQDLYNRALRDTEYTAAVLENEYLKATFMPEFGGKLWSLIDKTTGRDLLFANKAVRPCNLATRNAWLSGGVEWNCGFVGHGPYTCSPISVAQTALDDGTPVLRMYYFERIRAVTVQMDFFLPKESRMLFARMRIHNQSRETIPMYWWSNVGVAAHDGDRIVVPAVQSYSATPPVNGKTSIIKVPVPYHNGFDLTYPDNNPISVDWFFTTKLGGRPYIFAADRDGYGLCQTSTARLKGRKLFVWGNSQGGRKWSQFLTADTESGRYNEIQSGLAHTQYESLPMPPHTVWEWVEGYGAMRADPQKIHGDWAAARAEAELALDSIVSAQSMEQCLTGTRAMAKSPAKPIATIDGWGALESMRREKAGESPLSAHLDFGAAGDEQADWVRLLNEGTVGEHDPADVPRSYMRQAEWIRLLQDAVRGKDKENWYAHYVLGTACVALGDTKNAQKHLRRSLALRPSAWAQYALCVLYGKLGMRKKATAAALAAYDLRPHDLSLCKEVCRVLNGNGQYARLAALCESNAVMRSNARCKLYYAMALLGLGRIEESERILCGEDGKTYLVVPDIREGEESVTELWFALQKAKGKQSEEIGDPPTELDFRMFAAAKKGETA